MRGIDTYTPLSNRVLGESQETIPYTPPKGSLALEGPASEGI